MMVGLSCWCASPWATTSLPCVSSGTKPESHVPGNWPAWFGAGERWRRPTYRYRVSFVRHGAWRQDKSIIEAGG